MAALAAAAAAPAQTVAVVLESVATTVDLGPGFGAEPAWTYGGRLPGPLLRVTAGQTLRVEHRNWLAEPCTVHWHGQRAPLPFDGTAGLSRPEVATAQVRRYELTDLEPGTWLYRPQPVARGHQLERGLYGVLIVDPADPTTDPPFDVEAVVVLDDWRQPFGAGYDGHLLNGRTSAGQAPIQVGAGQRLRLRIVNAAARTNYCVALDGHPLTVTHADGRRVQPVGCDAVPLGPGERYDAIVDCTNPGVWSLAAAALGDRGTTVVRGIVRYTGATAAAPAPGFNPPNLATGVLLDYSQLASHAPSSWVAQPNLQQQITVESAMLGNEPVFSFNSQLWPTVLPTQVALTDTVEWQLQSVATGPLAWHPLYLHGHPFRLSTAAGGSRFAPVKDTVLLRPAGQQGDTLIVQFDADNPGSWLLHSMDVDQFAAGMVGLVEYTGDTDTDGVFDAEDREPHRALPVTMIPSDGAAFLPGAAGVVAIEWQPFQGCGVYLSHLESIPPQQLPPYGTLNIRSVSSAGQLVTDAYGRGALPYVIPPDPALAGFEVFLQPVCSTSMFGGARIGTMQPLRVR